MYSVVAVIIIIANNKCIVFESDVIILYIYVQEIIMSLTERRSIVNKICDTSACTSAREREFVSFRCGRVMDCGERHFVEE